MRGNCEYFFKYQFVVIESSERIQNSYMGLDDFFLQEKVFNN